MLPNLPPDLELVSLSQTVGYDRIVEEFVIRFTHSLRMDWVLPGVEATVWNAFFFPKGTPQPLVQKLNKALQDMIARPDVRHKLEELGLEIVPPEQRSPEYLAKMLPVEIERWGKVIKAANISMD